MAITTAINAAKTAIAALEIGTKAATVAQTGWNAAMAANPIGAVITAVALLAGGIALLASSQKDATEKQDIMSESQRAAVTASQEAAAAFAETKKSADELAAAEVANIDYTKQLWGELQTLTDENGKVQEGYEGRASFILGQLNEALGTEYTLNGNVIQSYKDIASEIDNVILKKKEEALFNAYLPLYQEALQNVNGAEQERAEHLIAAGKLSDELKEKEVALQDAEQERADHFNNWGGIFDAYFLNRVKKAQEEYDAVKSQLDDETAAYNTAEENVQGYYTAIANYQEAGTLSAEGYTDKAVAVLEDYNKEIEKSKDKVKQTANDEKKILEERVLTTQVSWKLISDEYEKNSESMTETAKTEMEKRIANAKDEAKQAKEDFAAVGGDMVKGIAEGADGSSWILNDAMQKIIDDAVAAARNAADSHSPSRRFKKMVGLTIGQGVAVGVDDSTKDVIKSVKKQVNAIQSAYNLDGFASAVDGGLTVRNAKTNKTNETPTTNTSGGVVINQTNNYSQAHSRYEIWKSKQNIIAEVRAVQGV